MLKIWLQSMFVALVLMVSGSAMGQACEFANCSDRTSVTVIRPFPSQGRVYFNLPTPPQGGGLNCGTNTVFSLDLTVPVHSELYALLLTAMVNDRQIAVEFDDTNSCATWGIVVRALQIF